MRRRLLTIVLALAAAACGTGSSEPLPSGPPAPVLGDIVPATPQSYRDIIATYRGRPLVVNFWASWCVPCVEEMPRLVEAKSRYGDRVDFLGVDVEDVTEDALEFSDKLGVDFPSIGDPRGEIRRAEKIVGLPTTHFYRSDGRLAFSHAGEINDEQLDSKLRELVRIDATSGKPAKDGADASPDP